MKHKVWFVSSSSFHLTTSLPHDLWEIEFEWKAFIHFLSNLTLLALFLFKPTLFYLSKTRNIQGGWVENRKPPVLWKERTKRKQTTRRRLSHYFQYAVSTTTLFSNFKIWMLLLYVKVNILSDWRKKWTGASTDCRVIVRGGAQGVWARERQPSVQQTKRTKA